MLLICIVRLCLEMSIESCRFLCTGIFLLTLSLIATGEIADSKALLYDGNLLLKMITPIVLIITYRELLYTEKNLVRRNMERLVRFYKWIFGYRLPAAIDVQLLF